MINKGDRKMTFKLLQKIIADNNIPEDVHLMSDSGWECDATDIGGIYYNEIFNLIIFTQGFDIDIPYSDDPKWKCLYKEDSKND